MNAGQQARADGGGNIIIQAQGDGIHIAVGLAHLTLIPPHNRVPQGNSEIDLLNPYGRAFGVVGREADLKSLWDWLHSTCPISIRTLTGRGGAGKTRAAVELVERLIQEKPGEWWAGFVQGGELRRFASQQNLANWSWARPTLVVVDYAASLVEPLRQWLRELAQNSARVGGKPLRLLLLEREAATDGGWLQYLCLGGYSDAGVLEFFDPLEPQRLRLLDTVEKRRGVLARMLEAAAPLVQCQLPKLPALGQNPRFDKQLESAAWEDPLYLMMAALLSLRSDLVEVLELPRTELAMRLVDHEIKRLTEGTTSPAAERLLVHLAAFAALGNGLNYEQALEVAEQESNALKLIYADGPGALLNRLHEVLPAPDCGIASVVPDVLAEALVIRALSKCSEAQQGATIRRAVQKLGWCVVPFIIRTAQDFVPAGHAGPLSWLESLIKSGHVDDVRLLVEIEDAMPKQTIVLREKALKVTELLLKHLEGLSKQNASVAVKHEYARLLNNLANWLSDLGRCEEALAKAQEAVQIYEQYLQSNVAFLPGLAAAHNTLSLILTGFGRREEALERSQKAVQIYEKLSQHGFSPILPNFVGSLNNLANALNASRRNAEAMEKAQEAVRISEQLANSEPDTFLSLFAASLHNLGTLLKDSSRPEEGLEKARKATRIFEQLAKSRPDTFLPDLAKSLNNLSNRLSELGLHREGLEKAWEALQASERLTKARPEAFQPLLASSLNNLAFKLNDFGPSEEALEKSQKATRIYEQLAKVLPDVYLPELVGSLGNLAKCLSALGRHEEAVSKSRVALQYYEQLGKGRSNEYQPDFASGLNNLAIGLNLLGQPEQALESAQEAVRIREQLANTQPDVFLPDLASSYGVKGAILQKLERYPEAAAASAQGIRALTPLFRMRPAAFALVIEALARDYLYAIRQAKAESDDKLLAPLVGIVEKIEQNP